MKMGLSADITRDSTPKGDKINFERLVDQYMTRVYNFCLRILRNTADAEDATQEVFMNLYSHRARLPEIRALTPWVMKIAHNIAINIYHKRYAHPVAQLDEDALQ
jgi:RNA polymerase sigma-70 factor (ECF subfamily)